MPNFDYSVVFKVESASVANSTTVDLTRFDVFFKTVPAANNNISGINNPGATLQLLPVVANTSPPIPDLTACFLAPFLRLPYAQLLASNNCSVPTRFVFPQPVTIHTDTPYALSLSLDGSDPGFSLWECVKGAAFANGSGNAVSGSTTQDILAFYTKPPALPVAVINNQTNTTSFVWYSNNGINPDLTTWLPLSGRSLTCSIHAARYFVSGNSVCHGGAANNYTANTTNTVSNGSVTVLANQVTNTIGSNLIYVPSGNTVDANNILQVRVPASPNEYITFNKSASDLGPLQLAVGEPVYQNTVFWPGGANLATVSVVNTSNQVAANTGFDWATVFSFSNTVTEYIVVFSEDQWGAGQDAVSVSQVTGLGSTNNLLNVLNPIYFTNTLANFMKSPVGYVQSSGTVQHFGSILDIVVLANTNSNGSVRFVNDSINTLLVNVIGTGYANSDYVTVTGFENVAGVIFGGYSAVANIATFANGSISNIYLSNVGAGFVNAASIGFTVSNSTNQPSVGTGATFTVNVGTMVKGMFLGGDGTGGELNAAKVINMPVHFVIPYVLFSPASGVTLATWHEWGFYENSYSTTYSGRAAWAYTNPANTLMQMQNQQALPIPHDHQPIIPSRSNEWIIPWETGTVSNATTNATSVTPIDVGGDNSSVFFVNAVSNNDWASQGISAANTKLLYGRYIYNNDYTNENTDTGNAWSKYVSTTISLIGNGAYAEDAVAYLTAYRPANTDLKVFVRVRNSSDSESLSTKDWTLLTVNALTKNLYSSPLDQSDLVDLNYTFGAYPNSAALGGTAQTVLNSYIVTGAGTTWSTNVTINLVSGSLVKLWQPLFPNNYMVTQVTTVTNDTSITLAEPVSNNGLVGAGLMLDKVLYPYQAYLDVLNNNLVTYWTHGGAKILGYDQLVVKVCLLSSNDSIYPEVADLRVVSLSA